MKRERVHTNAFIKKKSCPVVSVSPSDSFWVSSLCVVLHSMLADKCCLLVAGCGADAVLLVVEEDRVSKMNSYAPR